MVNKACAVDVVSRPDQDLAAGCDMGKLDCSRNRRQEEQAEIEEENSSLAANIHPLNSIIFSYQFV